MSEIAIATLLRQQGQTDKAAEGLMRWLGQHPKDDQAWATLADCMLELGDPAKAEVAFRRAIASNPGRLDLALPLAHALQSQGKHDLGLQVLQNAHAQAPEDIDVIMALGMALAQLNQAEAALAMFDAACQAQSNHSAAWAFKSLTHTRLRQYEAGLSAANHSLSLLSDNPQAWFARGRVLQKMGRWHESAQALETALEQHPEHQLALDLLASIRVTLAEEDRSESEAIEISRLNAMGHLAQHMRQYTSPSPLREVNFFRFKHDVEQAQYFLSQGVGSDAVKRLVALGGPILARDSDPTQALTLDDATLLALKQFWLQRQPVDLPALPGACLNPQLNWSDIEHRYLSQQPEIVVIDDFLSPQALAAFQRYNLWSPAWTSEYPDNKYLGGFSAKGYISELHLQLGRDLRAAMPGVFKDHRLMEFWGFKYDAHLGKGINVHADHAQVNLNFWVTPDEYNLDPASGGLRVYDAPAPADWSFDDYNHNADKIYAFLRQKNSGEQVVTYRCNRAVLFNSALFHETDTVNFADTYVDRRVNMTYLFGEQLGD
ncbi:MAG: tetratricopeptide repeat protein [Alphaproteobacteria bacterium]|nr:tetratricopeptide repeat protein [Alphaproteobacteria bacterium]